MNCPHCSKEIDTSKLRIKEIKHSDEDIQLMVAMRRSGMEWRKIGVEFGGVRGTSIQRAIEDRSGVDLNQLREDAYNAKHKRKGQ